MGSILTARLEGINAAPRPTITSTTQAEAIVAGSHAGSSNNRLERPSHVGRTGRSSLAGP